MDHAALSRLLVQGRWFADLDPALQKALLTAATLKRLPDQARLFSRGDPGDGLYAVVEGALCITATTEQGRELLLTRMDPPTWFGEIAVFDRQARTHDCIADGDSTVLHIPLGALDKLLAEDPRRFHALGLLVAHKLRLAFTALEDLAALPLKGRLARRLVVLAEGHGERVGGSKRTIDVTQEQLAAMLSASRQSVNQALRELEAAGLLQLSYGQVTLLDLPALRAL
jgi:CRP/FNR family transcriptional regulator, cyclic AMP receptor protein